MVEFSERLSMLFRVELAPEQGQMGARTPMGSPVPHSRAAGGAMGRAPVCLEVDELPVYLRAVGLSCKQL